MKAAMQIVKNTLISSIKLTIHTYVANVHILDIIITDMIKIKNIIGDVGINQLRILYRRKLWWGKALVNDHKFIKFS